MGFQSIICRFLSLLDIFLIMLGVLVISIASAQYQHEKEELFAQTTAQLEKLDNDPELVYQRVLASQLLRGMTLVYAETAAGSNFDRCFLLDEDGKPKKEIPLVTSPHPSDIPEISSGMTLVILISGAGFDSKWTKKRIEKIEKTFEVHVIPLYNIELQF